MPQKIGHKQSSIRKHNRQRVLDIIRSCESITIPQLSKEIHLSKTTVIKIIEHLQSENLIINMGKDMSVEDRGKRPELYKFNQDFGYVISITIFGTYILAGLYNAEGTIFYKEKTSIHSNENLESVIAIIVKFIQSWQDPEALPNRNLSRLLGIVLASTGVTDTSQGVCFTASLFTSWPTNAPIKEMITREVDLKAPFYIDNYNRYFAFAEQQFGGFKEYSNLVDIVANHDGLGSGVIINNKILRGKKYLSGEVGHMILNPDFPELCTCGGRGCFHQLINVENLLNQVEPARTRRPDSHLFTITDRPLTIHDIFESADREDVLAREILNSVIKWFAIGIQNISLFFNPDVIIISGTYSQGGTYFLETLRKEVEKVSLVRMDKEIRIEYSTLDEEAPLRGAACYVIEDYFSKVQDY